MPPGVSTLAQTNVPWSASVEVCFQSNRREAGRPPAGLQERAMVKRIAPIRVVSLILLAACGALCQKPPPADLLQGLQFDGSDSPQVQRQEMRRWSSLPDAPSSVQPPRAERFLTFVDETGSPVTLGAVGISAGAMRGTELGHATPGLQPSLTAHYQVTFIQQEPSAFFGKYLSPSSLNPRYYASTSDSFMGRASYAASRIF